MSSSRALTDVRTPRRISLSVSRPNQRSTWLVQDDEDLHRPAPAAIADRLTFHGTIIESGLNSYLLKRPRIPAFEP